MRKRILIVSAVFPPEPVVSARSAGDFYSYLKAKGHEVTVLCPQPSRYSGNWTPKNDTADIFRLNSYTCKEYSILGRLRESWSFGRKVSDYIRSSPRQYDVCYLISWPVFGSYYSAKAAQRYGIKVVHHIQDVYPEALATKLGGWKYKLAFRLLLPFEKKATQASDVSLLLTEKLKEEFCKNRKISAEKVEIFPNWLDETDFIKVYSKEDVCKQYGIPEDRFTFMYFGNIGPLAGVETVLHAFGKGGFHNCQLIIAGEGSQKKNCLEIVQREGMKNVLFISEPDANKVGMVQSVADVLILPMKAGPGSTSVPSKLMAYMLSGKPVLASVDRDSEVADEVCKADCGIVVLPENSEEMKTGMECFISTPLQEMKRWGENARQYGLNRYSKAKALERLEKILIEVERCFI